MALNVIMMGPPGAGKGTQAERFARERKLLKISTGEILREAVHAQTPVGLKAKATIDAGKLVDDATMIAIVRERLMRPDAMGGFVLDGFPRTIAQAEALDAIVAERDGGPLIVLNVRVPEAELVKRLSTRRICGKCGANADPFDSGASGNRCNRCGGEFVQRTDDNADVVRKRLAIYEQGTKPLVEYYKDRPTFRYIDGAQPPDHVAAQMNAIVDEVGGAGARAGRPPGPGKRAERL
jgi:adenylate kinase